MTDLDRQIADALDAEDNALRSRFGEQGLFEQAFDVFKGKQGGVAMIAAIAMFVLFGGAFYSGYQFLNGSNPEETIMWGAAAWFLMTMVAFSKVWFWMRMESNRVIREVKRLELQIARMAD